MADREAALHGYVTDMLALEEHIHKAVSAQVESLDGEQLDALRTLAQVLAHIDRHVEQLRELSTRFDVTTSKIGEAVKRAGSTVLGVGAAAIDLVRTEKLPRNVRDDYTAASLAFGGYVMLHTTAAAFEDREVARLAAACLDDYADILMLLQELLPVVVIYELRREGFDVVDSAVAETLGRVDDTWRRADEVALARQAALSQGL